MCCIDMYPMISIKDCISCIREYLNPKLKIMNWVFIALARSQGIKSFSKGLLRNFAL